VFRRGRRFEATTGPSSRGVDEQPFWLTGQEVPPERVLVTPKAALLRYDSPPWLIDQELRRHQRERSHAASPLRGVSTQEVLDALGAVFSPDELDWELVGVAFVNPDPTPAAPKHQTAGAVLEAPPWAVEPDAPVTGSNRSSLIDQAFIPAAPRKWLPEHDEIMAAVRDLAWEGYYSLIADAFRREGYEVFEGEGLDREVIDMEVVRGAERMLVNCQLRGLNEIGVEPLLEMAQVADRVGADGAFIVTDGDFATDAWALAAGQALILIDRRALVGLVLDVTLGADRDKRLTTQMRRLLSALQPGAREQAS
jgi:hypothetical protein